MSESAEEYVYKRGVGWVLGKSSLGTGWCITEDGVTLLVELFSVRPDRTLYSGIVCCNYPPFDKIDGWISWGEGFPASYVLSRNENTESVGPVFFARFTRV